MEKPLNLENLKEEINRVVKSDQISDSEKLKAVTEGLFFVLDILSQIPKKELSE